MEYNKNCENCNTSFISMEKLISYCSDECRKRLIKCNCKKCDKLFFAKRKRVYCSDDCRKRECVICDKLYMPNTTESYCSEECKIKKYTHNCKSCGEDFLRYSSKVSYCSTTCQITYERAKKERRICGHCKKLMIITNTMLLYCSETCRDSYYEEKEKEKKSKEISNENIISIVKYHVETLIDKRNEVTLINFQSTVDYNNLNGFNESLKRKIRSRDGNKCYICNCNHGLEVHHIIPRKLGGSHREENLITLCGSCHRHIETGDKDHAIRKCTENAKQNYNIPVIELKEKLSKFENIAFIEKELNRVYNKISETYTDHEHTEILIDIDNLFDNISKLKEMI